MTKYCEYYIINGGDACDVYDDLFKDKSRCLSFLVIKARKNGKRYKLDRYEPFYKVKKGEIYEIPPLGVFRDGVLYDLITNKVIEPFDSENLSPALQYANYYEIPENVAHKILRNMSSDALIEYKGTLNEAEENARKIYEENNKKSLETDLILKYKK